MRIDPKSNIYFDSNILFDKNMSAFELRVYGIKSNYSDITISEIAKILGMGNNYKAIEKTITKLKEKGYL